jgi:cytochrome P450
MSRIVVRDPAQVSDVLRRHEDFLPTNALTSVVALHPATLRALNHVGFALPPVLATATGPQHRAARGIVSGFFSADKVAAIRPRVIELTGAHCRTLAQELRTGRRADLTTVADPIPPAILSELIGLAMPELGLLKRWSQDSLELFWGWPDPARQLELAASASEFYCWLREQIHASTGDHSLFAALRHAGMAVTDICSLGYFLLIAGQETTAQLTAIAYYRALTERRWPQLTDHDRARDFVRRMLACESPVSSWRRTASRDTQLNGRPVPAGAEILLELSGHHRADAPPGAFTLAFGHGIHRCLGAKLAELEAVTIVGETARMLPALTLSGPEPEWLKLLSFRAPRTVPVQLSRL